MIELRFEGFGDDTFGELAHFDVGYDCGASGAAVVFELRAGDGGLLVWGQYGGADWPSWAPPCWLIGTQLLDEGVPLPDWPAHFEESDTAYSHALIIEAPDDVRLTCLSAEI